MKKSLSEKGKSTFVGTDKIKLHALIWGTDEVSLLWLSREVNKEITKRRKHNKLVKKEN